MKKLWMALMALAFVSCENEPVDYAIVSGKITNANTNEITIYGITDSSFKEKLTLSEDGSFTDTLKVGSFLISQGRNRTPLYLNAGDNIHISFNATDFSKSLLVTGKGNEISNYLIAKTNIENELMGKGTGVYVKEEADYLKIVYNIKKAQNKALEEATGISESHKALEKKANNYSYLEKINRYKTYHAHYAKKPGFNPSKEFLSDLDGLVFDNEADFKFSSKYRTLVTSHYRVKASELGQKENISRGIAMLKVGGEIENEYIKNTLLYDAAKYNITYTDDIESFYAAYVAAGSTNVDNNEKITKSYNALKVLAKGNPSPKFLDYENFAGGTTSLDDLKGKYVYVDVWATWCGPCKAEIPYLKKVEKQYHGKNIHFLSLSIDVKSDHGKWETMIKEKELGGIQLFADNDWNSKFIQDYMIKGIPRFILIDPNGDIVSSNAPRPSSKKLIQLFDELKI